MIQKVHIGINLSACHMVNTKTTTVGKTFNTQSLMNVWHQLYRRVNKIENTDTSINYNHAFLRKEKRSQMSNTNTLIII